MTTPYHTIIIGAGPGGLTAAVGLAGFGKRVALIEKHQIGGDCTNVGCVPSKTLIHLAKHVKDGKLPSEILERVRDKRNRLREEETTWVKNLDNLDVFEGKACLKSRNEVEITLASGDTQRLQTKNVVIATGATARMIPIAGLSDVRTLTNESLFEQDDAPKHLAILGAGPIGTEMSFAFKRLGSLVSLIDLAPAPMSVVGEEAAKVVAQSLEANGVSLYMNAKATRYDESSETLVLEQNGREIKLGGVDKVLVAIGRVPVTQELGLEEVGVKIERNGIPVGLNGETNVKGVYAIGDASTTSRFTHSANAQGRRLVKRLALPFLPSWGKEPEYPSATFSEPEVATIGQNYNKLSEHYHPKLIKTLRVELKDTDKGYTEGLEQGFVLIHAMRLTGRILAAVIVAPKASEMISVLTMAVYQRISLYKLANLVVPYPTLSEAIKKAADTYMLETLPKLPQELGAYVRYRFASPSAGHEAQQEKPQRKASA